ncbi:MAG: M48 family metallopeptidase [Verrucomicrobiota bacterium]
MPVAPSLQQQFELNQKYERQARNRPFFYQTKVWTLALICYLGAWLPLLLAVVFGVLVGWLTWLWTKDVYWAGGVGAALLVLLLVVLWRVFHVRMDLPSARWLSEKEAPELFKVIEEIRQKLGCGPLHHVGVSLDHNAFLAAIPRWGLWSWPRHYLVLGVPLLLGMPREEARAVVAHELSHLSRRHNRLGNFVWRNVQIWARLSHALGQYSGFIRRRLQRMALFFNRSLGLHASVVSRENEFEADRLAAEVTSPKAAASGLLRIEAIGRLMDRDFWYSIKLMRADVARPPQDILERSRQCIQEAAHNGSLQAHLASSLARRRDLFDSHPSLSERLANLHQDATVIDWTAPADACETLLAPAWLRLLTDAELAWQQMAHEAWQDQHLECEALKKTLARLRPVWDTGNFNQSLGWQFVSVCIRLYGPVASLPLLDYLILRHPRFDKALMERARILLYLENEAGLDDLRRAMDLNHDNKPEGYDLMATFFQEHGREEEFRALFDRIDEMRELLQLSQAERETITSLDGIVPADIDAADREALLFQLESIPEISRAYLACKRVQHLPTRRHYVIGIQRGAVRKPNQKPLNDAQFGSILASVLNLPGSFHVIVKNTENAWLYRRISRHKNSLVYDERLQPESADASLTPPQSALL